MCGRTSLWKLKSVYIVNYALEKKPVNKEKNAEIVVTRKALNVYNILLRGLFEMQYVWINKGEQIS